MVELAIRRAVARDAKALAALAEETFIATFGHLYPASDLQPFLSANYGEALQASEIADPGGVMLVAERAGALLGYLYAGAMGLPYDCCGRMVREIKRLYVREEAKGVGVAQKLIDEAIAWATAQGAQDVYLGVFAENHRALAFYRRNGFEIVGSYHFMVGKTADDERIMRKTIKPPVPGLGVGQS